MCNWPYVYLWFLFHLQFSSSISIFCHIYISKDDGFIWFMVNSGPEFGQWKTTNPFLFCHSQVQNWAWPRPFWPKANKSCERNEDIWPEYSMSKTLTLLLNFFFFKTWIKNSTDWIWIQQFRKTHKEYSLHIHINWGKIIPNKDL